MTVTDEPRRAFLLGLAASPVVIAGMGTFPKNLHAQARDAGLVSPNVCMIMPETTEGPYYFDPELVRRDITENRPGRPLELTIQVVDAACRPIKDARVDVWHCDAEGNYSGYRANQGGDTRGETFLRGTQMSDALGQVHFDTIYPGWYPGRTIHIHYKVFLDQVTVLTSQIFFADDVSNRLIENTPPYNGRGRLPDTSNSRDFIARRMGDGGYAQVTETGAALTAALVVGVAQT